MLALEQPCNITIGICRSNRLPAYTTKNIQHVKTHKRHHFHVTMTTNSLHTLFPALEGNMPWKYVTSPQYNTQI